MANTQMAGPDDLKQIREAVVSLAYASTSHLAPERAELFHSKVGQLTLAVLVAERLDALTLSAATRMRSLIADASDLLAL